MGLGIQEVLIIALVIVVLFAGPKFMRDFARGSGEAIKELKNIRKEIDHD